MVYVFKRGQFIVLVVTLILANFWSMDRVNLISERNKI